MRQRERGAVAVEFALGGMLLAVLFFGALEFGLMMRTSNNLANASREAVRTAASMPREDGFQNAALQVINGATRNTGRGTVAYATVYRADPTTGLPVNGQGLEDCNTDCYRYVWDDGLGFVQQLGAQWDAQTQKACGDDVNHDWIGVYLRAEHEWVSGFFDDSTTLTDHVVMRLEPVPRGEKCR